MKPAVEKKRNCNDMRPNNGPAPAAAARVIATVAPRSAVKHALTVKRRSYFSLAAASTRCSPLAPLFLISAVCAYALYH